MAIVNFNVIEEFLKEVETGRVETEDHIYNIKIYVNTVKDLDYDNLIPILKVRDKEKFRLKIEEYIQKIILFNSELEVNDDFIKNSLAHLFANATFTDLENPELFIDKYIQFMNEKEINIKTVEALFNKEVKTSDIAYNSNLVGRIEKQSSFQETPYAFKSSVIKDEVLNFQLPTISFGIDNDVCYIYAIQKEKNKGLQTEQSLKYNKRINRLLYKLNDKVKEHETQEYLDYKNSSDYYPENMTDVVPSAILALSFFLNILYENGIDKIKVVSFLPIRYNAKKVAFEYIIKSKIQKDNLNEEDGLKLIDEYKKEHLRIQDNLTQKLLRNFNRLCFHFNNIKIVSYPFEQDELLSINLSEFIQTNNNILEKIIERGSIKTK